MNIIKKLISLVFVLILTSFSVQDAFAAPPTNFQSSIVVGSGLNGPSGFEIAPDGRIFILERTGKIKIYKNGQLLSTPFADLPSMATGDRGLIGIEFDPDFATNHYVYFYYTGLDKLNRLVRFDASGDIASNGPVILFETTAPSEWLHVGGSIRFGLDGKIYFAVGDNGYPPNGQDLSNPHGKIHRINRDGTVPTDNPFYGQAGKVESIWAYGFRNPWRFQFDSVTGKLYGGDVGDFSVEEVNHIQKGKNYGWPICEGVCSGHPEFVNPIHEYLHAGESAAVTGGPIYRSSMFPTEYQGRLFFADYAKGFIKTLTLDSDGNATGVQDFDTSAGSVVELKTGNDGSLYYLTYYPGRLYRITYSTTNHMPVASAGSDVTKGVEPLTVNFTSNGSYDPNGDPLTYLWDFGDGTTSMLPNPSKTYSQKGTYTVELHVSDGPNTAQSVPIVVQVGNTPILTIVAPVDNSKYRAGDTVNWQAGAVDEAGFDIDDGDIKTEVLFHHGTHIHPFLGPLPGRTGQFTIPTENHEPSGDTWFEINITATDTNGLSTTKSVSIYPEKSLITLNSVVSGLKLFLDGIPVVTSHIVEGVVGYIREVSVEVTQTLNGIVYTFTHWSDGGQAKHTITTPEDDVVLSAYFEQAAPFSAQYFDNLNLSGAPKLTRLDPEINFTWDAGSPDPIIPNENFSVRWTKEQHFAFGRYKFTTSTDDGVRLYVDGNLVINQWHDQGTIDYTATVDLTEGNHEITMEYFEHNGGAVAKLKWELTPDQPVMPTPTITPAPTVPPTVETYSIFDDTLKTGWSDWSWGSVVNFNMTTPTYAGTKSLSFTPTSPWAGLRLHSDLGVDASPYLSLKFAVYGSTANQKLAAVLYDTTQTMIGTQLLLANYGGDPVSGQWKVYDIPLADFQAQGKQIGSVILQEWGGAINSSYYVDVLGLVGQLIGTPTPTETPTPTPTPAGPTPTPQPGLSIYDDALQTGWSDWSWGSTINLSTTNPVYSGVNSIAFTPQTAWAGLKLHHDVGVNSTPYLSVNFAARASVPNQKLAVVLFDETNTMIGTQIPLSEYGGNPPVDSWKVYDIPLSVFQTNGKTISSIVLQEWGGAIQSPVYVDVLNLPSGLTPTPTPTPTAGPTPTPTLPPANETYTAKYWNTPGAGSKPVIPTRTPDLVRQELEIKHEWNDVAPDPLINLDHYVAVWTKTHTFEAGSYKFTTESDDGIRVYIDNESVIDQWNDHGKTTHTGEKTLPAGEHEIKVEFYENAGGAIATFKFEKITTSPVGFIAEYFNNITLTGTPVLTRTETNIFHIWDDGSPDPLLPVDLFSARWTKQKQFTAGNYTFTLQSDDGIRFWIDDVIVVDDWTDHAMKTYNPTVAITEGIHTLKIEYYENGGGAVAIFSEPQ